MKIAMVSEHASPLAALGEVDAGGQNLHVAELSAALARAGNDVTVYTRREDRVQPDEVRAPAGYHVVHVPAGPPRPMPKDELLPHMGAFAKFLEREWSAWRPDVVHAHFWMSGLVSVTAGRVLDIPVTQTFHALGVVKRRHQGSRDTSPAERVRLESRIGRDAARIVATCTNEVSELAGLGIPGEQVSVVPCGVDLEWFTPHGPVLERNGRPRIVAVGRLVRRKGFDTAIEALPDLPGAELVIAGGPREGRLAEDDEARRLAGVAERLGVRDRVRLPGQVARRDMPALLRSADVVVCTPWYEPFGIVPLEAMACGVPVVASAVGGLTDTVVDGGSGRLVPPRRPDAVADAVGGLLADPAARESYGAAGLARAHRHYSWDHVAASTHEAYAQVAGLVSV